MAKKGCECPPPCPGWIYTYGDMMTLLLVFFVLLLTFAQMDKVKFEKMAGAMKDAFGVQRIAAINPQPTGNRIVATEFNQEIILVRLIEKLQLVLEEMIDNGDAEVVEEEDGFVINLSMEMLFDKGSMRINPEVEPILQQMANQLSGIPNLVHVTGHTDNRPVDPTGPYPNNWAISAAQAAVVVNYLSTKGGVDPTRLQTRGMGAFSPRKSNDTPEGRAANRRVEVMITRQTQATTPNKFVESSGLSDNTDLAEITSGVEK